MRHGIEAGRNGWKQQLTFRDPFTAMARAREVLDALARKRLAMYGLTTQQWRLIEILATGEAESISALARAAGLGIQSTSRILAELSRRGFVAMEAADAKSKRVGITGTGIEVVLVCMPFFREFDRKVEEVVGSDTLDQLDRLLAEVGELMGETRQSPGRKT